MKKLTSLAVFGLAVSAVAAPTKLADVTFADQATLVKQATKLGELSGVPFIGIGAVGALSSNPVAEKFGAMRPNELTVVTVVGDPDLYKDTEESFEKFTDSVKFTVLYPGSKSKADFLAANAGAVETNGVIRLDDEEFAAFSEDGKWVSFGNCEKGVLAVLADAGKARLTAGEAFRATITEPAVEILAKLVEASRNKRSSSGEFDLDIDQMVQMYEAIKSISGVSFAVKASPAGFDVMTERTLRPGTAYSNYGTALLDSADPLAFAGAVPVAVAHAANCHTIDGLASLKAVTGFLNRHGIKTDFIAVEGVGAASRITLDIDAAIAYFKGEGEAAVEALDDDEGAEKDFADTIAEAIKPSDAPSSVAFAIKGLESGSTASARFASAFPEFAGRRFSEVYVVSLYETMCRLGDKFASLDEDNEQMIRSLLQTLPPAGNACIAGAAWREGDKAVKISRVTPEELKGLATVLMTMGISGTSSAMTIGSAYECEDLEDDDEDDDEDDED